MDRGGERNSWTGGADPFPAVKIYQPLFIYAESHQEQLQDLLSAIRAVEDTALKTTAINARDDSSKIPDHKGSIAELRRHLEQVVDEKFLSNQAPAAPPTEIPAPPIRELTTTRKMVSYMQSLTKASETQHGSETIAGQALLALPEEITACAGWLRETAKNYTHVLSEAEQDTLRTAAEKCDTISSDMLHVRERAITPERSFSETFERIARGYGYPDESPSR